VAPQTLGERICLVVDPAAGPGKRKSAQQHLEGLSPVPGTWGGERERGGGGGGSVKFAGSQACRPRHGWDVEGKGGKVASSLRLGKRHDLHLSA